MTYPQWVVDVKGIPCSNSWEISVIRSDFAHGFESYGWFGSKKKLIGHNGGPCQDYVDRFVWDRLIQLANDYCEELNRKELL